MRYAVARYNESQRDIAYRIYVTEALRMMTEHTAYIHGGSFMTAKYMDVLKSKPVDNRTGDEIALDIIERAGLEVVG